MCLITALLLGLFLFVFMKKGTSIEIRIRNDSDNRDVTYTYPLAEDGYIVISFNETGNPSVSFESEQPDIDSIKGSEGISDLNIVQIKDYTADMIYADCPDLICVNSRSISRVGESIICLPHRLTVTVTGTDRSQAGPDDTDAVTW